MLSFPACQQDLPVAGFRWIGHAVCVLSRLVFALPQDHDMPSRPPARRRFSAVCLLCVGLIASASAPLHAESSNSLLSVSEDGRLLATVNRDNGTVSIVALARRQVLREI